MKKLIIKIATKILVKISGGLISGAIDKVLDKDSSLAEMKGFVRSNFGENLSNFQQDAVTRAITDLAKSNLKLGLRKL